MAIGICTQREQTWCVSATHRLLAGSPSAHRRSFGRACLGARSTALRTAETARERARQARQHSGHGLLHQEAREETAGERAVTGAPAVRQRGATLASAHSTASLDRCPLPTVPRTPSLEWIMRLALPIAMYSRARVKPHRPDGTRDQSVKRTQCVYS